MRDIGGHLPFEKTSELLAINNPVTEAINGISDDFKSQRMRSKMKLIVG